MNPLDQNMNDDNYLPSFGEQKQYWDRRWRETPLPNEWQTRRGETVLGLLRSLRLKNPAIMDLGCGTGWFTNELSACGKATGVDLSEAAIDIARRRFPGVNYVAGNLYELPFPEASFDVVVSQEVIAHVSNPRDFLKRISEFLQRDGHLIITTANRVVIERTDLPPDPREHIKQWLDRKAFRRILSEYFSVLSMTSIIPLGDRGFLRVVNSRKLNSVLGAVFTPGTLQDWKERAGLGYSLVALARKKSV